jgi:hypothetical protein
VTTYGDGNGSNDGSSIEAADSDNGAATTAQRKQSDNTNNESNDVGTSNGDIENDDSDSNT